MDRAHVPTHAGGARLTSRLAAEDSSLLSVAYLGAAVGLALFTALIAYQGVGEVAAALTRAGTGLVVVALFHLVPLVTNAIGWRSLLSPRPPLATLVWARWISESVNGLLPVAQIGGNVVRAGLIARRGVPGPQAGASVVVDITLNVLTQIVFTLLGLCLLAIHIGYERLALPVAIGMTIMGALLAGFYFAQREGLFGGTARWLALASRRLRSTAIVDEGQALDAAIGRLYRAPRALVATALWHLVSWIVGAGEVWLALRFLGHPVPLTTALLLESLGQAIRTGAFVVPGALGVQEGGYLLIGTFFGIPSELSIACSLTKRARELLLGLPGLLAWQVERAATSLRPEAAQGDGG